MALVTASGPGVRYSVLEIEDGNPLPKEGSPYQL